MTSRKLIICLLASMVMRNPLLLKMRHRGRHAKDDPVRKIQAS